MRLLRVDLHRFDRLSLTGDKIIFRSEIEYHINALKDSMHFLRANVGRITLDSMTCSLANAIGAVIDTNDLVSNLRKTIDEVTADRTLDTRDETLGRNDFAFAFS